MSKSLDFWPFFKQISKSAPALPLKIIFHQIFSNNSQPTIEISIKIS